MKAFKVTGTFKMRPGMQKFEKEVAAKDERAAAEQVMSILGSKHKAKRREISITGVVAISEDDVKSSVVRYRVKA